MNRRSFVLSVAAASAGAAVRVRGAEAKQFDVGFLGLSHSHAKEKLRLVRQHPAFHFVGAAEESAEVRNAHAGVRWMTEEQLLQSCEVVFVESDVRDHARQAAAALRAGKHVHVEKPPSVRYEEMVELVQLARERNLLFQSGYMWRTHPGFNAIFEAVRQGWLGEVYQVRGTINTLIAPARRAEWAEFSGGGFFELAAHLVDSLVRLLGRPARVSPFLASTMNDTLVDNNVAVFEFPRAVGVITNTTEQPNASAHRSFEVLGKNGTMTLKPIEPPVLHVDLAQAAGPYKQGSQVVPLPKYARYVGDIDELVSALRRERDLTASLADELLVQEWLLRASGMFAPAVPGGGPAK
jgi:predicted dehydrogenase